MNHKDLIVVRADLGRHDPDELGSFCSALQHELGEGYQTVLIPSDMDISCPTCEDRVPLVHDILADLTLEEQQQILQELLSELDTNEGVMYT